MFYLSLILCHRYCFFLYKLVTMNSIHLEVMIRRERNFLFYCDHCLYVFSPIIAIIVLKKRKKKKKKVRGKIRATCEIVVCISDLLFIPLVPPLSPPLFTDYSLTIFYISLSTYSTYLHTLFMKSIISRV